MALDSDRSVILQAGDILLIHIASTLADQTMQSVYLRAPGYQFQEILLLLAS